MMILFRVLKSIANIFCLVYTRQNIRSKREKERENEYFPYYYDSRDTYVMLKQTTSTTRRKKTHRIRLIHSLLSQISKASKCVHFSFFLIGLYRQYAYVWVYLEKEKSYSYLKTKKKKKKKKKWCSCFSLSDYLCDNTQLFYLVEKEIEFFE